MTRKSNEDIVLMPLLEDIKKGLKELTNNKIDYAKIDDLSKKMHQNLDMASEQVVLLKESVEATRKPVVNENRHTIDIQSKGTFTVIIVQVVIIVLLMVKLFYETRPNYNQEDNDLKYRYIKMKGEATPTTINELENIFNLNRNNSKIRQMLKDVETFEQTVHKKAQLDEQSRLQQLESKRLDERASELKQK